MKSKKQMSKIPKNSTYKRREKVCGGKTKHKISIRSTTSNFIELGNAINEASKCVIS